MDPPSFPWNKWRKGGRNHCQSLHTEGSQWTHSLLSDAVGSYKRSDSPRQIDPRGLIQSRQPTGSIDRQETHGLVGSTSDSAARLIDVSHPWRFQLKPLLQQKDTAYVLATQGLHAIATSQKAPGFGGARRPIMLGAAPSQ